MDISNITFRCGAFDSKFSKTRVRLFCLFTVAGFSNRCLRGNAFAFFPKNQRRWTSAPYKKENIEMFHSNCKHEHYNGRTDLLPHGSYLINLGNPDAAKRAQAQESFEDDLKRCEQLGVGLYNLHPGSAVGGADKRATIEHIASGINKGIGATKFVKVVLENMAGHGHIIGSDLQDLADIIELVTDKSRVGVCIDTCHAFAAGYDIRDKETFDAFWAKYDNIVGYKYLSGLHVNDSKAPLGSKRDLHQNIGLGFLGLETFRLLMNKEEIQGLPMILETPVEDEAKVAKGLAPDIRGDEIKLLEWLIGKEADDAEVLERSAELQKKGEKERKEHQDKFDKKKDKEETAAAGGKKRKATVDQDFFSGKPAAKKTRAASKKK